MSVFVLDNYDSFTYNLVQRLGEIDRTLDIRVARNDQITRDEIERMKPERIIISPGPCTPNEAGISKQVIEYFGPADSHSGRLSRSSMYRRDVSRAGASGRPVDARQSVVDPS